MANSLKNRRISSVLNMSSKVPAAIALVATFVQIYVLMRKDDTKYPI